ncbi:uncharacterized protein LOC108050244 [Drosophila rhopaloa]|uniref:Cilia- and flagella-associated protein 91 n=1 Tax=Drosophila rhopaloa TaxID=1041015 RepID=A0ABM5HYM3_DRORH|nr:uncharacterized protein LOC108050244 [Drosophila rhopaloa]
MPSAKEKLLRKERILQFIRENRELRPINSTSVLQSASPRKDESLRQKKRVSFTHGKQQRSFGESAKSRDNENIFGQGLTSCLITKPSDTRLTGGVNNSVENEVENSQADNKSQFKSLYRRSPDSRLTAGANNPAVRNVGRLPRTDSECHFNEPGIFFLQKVHSDLASQEVKLNSKRLRKELKNKCDYFPKYVDNRPFKDEATQTLYRESSAQTLAFLPEILNRERFETVELFTLAKLLPGDKPPGLREVEFLERSRKRWDFSKALKTNMKRLLNEARKVSIKTEYKEILDAFEWEQWIQREEDIQECQMMRLEIVIKMFDKREKEMHAASKARIEKSFEHIEKRRQAGLRKNEVEFQRGMRRISIQLAKTSRKWEKQSPMQALGSACSEFYGPLIRHGVDPARRCFESSTGRKAFDMRIDDLEKRVNMRNVQCPFSKLKEWSKPKEYDKEYERNFCNDDNLQRLYESLKTLRTQADTVKDAPNCLKTRLRIERRTPSTDSSDSYRPYDMVSRKTRIAEYTSASHINKPTRISKVSQKAEKPQRDSMRGREDLEHLICSYEGSYIGSIMQFLADEMQRLKEQRKLHFFCILAQKERWKRESAEAGLRQKENAMRMVYEEMIQYCNVAHSEAAQQYADTILSTDIEHMIEDEAAETVTEMAKQIDADIERWLESFKLMQTPLTFTPLRLMLQDMVCPDMGAVLQRYETSMIAGYIVEDVIFGRVWKELEPYDISTTLTSDLIDRLIDNDLYLFSSDSECEGPQKSSWVEGHAIIRKLIRQAVPGRRWKEENERIVTEVYKSLFDDVFSEILFKIENPEPVLPSDLLRLRPSKSYTHFGQDIPKTSTSEEKVSRSDSMQPTTLLRMQFLALVKKYKAENITRELKRDKKYSLPENDSGLLDFIKSEELQQTEILNIQPNTPQPELFSIKSTVDLSEYVGNLNELRGSSVVQEFPLMEEPILAENVEEEIKSSSSEEKVERLTADPIQLERLQVEQEETEIELEIEKEIVAKDTEDVDQEDNISNKSMLDIDGATTTKDDEFEEEHSEMGEEVVVFYPKDSQLFKFR